MKTYLQNIDWKNILERALWTFVEGALVSLPVTLSMDMDGAAWKSALFSAILGGVSALKTFILDIARQHTAKVYAEIEKEAQEQLEQEQIERDIEEHIPEEAYADYQGARDDEETEQESEK